MPPGLYPSTVIMSLWNPWLCPSMCVNLPLSQLGSSLFSFSWEPSCFGEGKTDFVLRFGGCKLSMVPSFAPLLDITIHLDGLSSLWHPCLDTWACSQTRGVRRQAGIPHPLPSQGSVNVWTWADTPWYESATSDFVQTDFRLQQGSGKAPALCLLKTPIWEVLHWDWGWCFLAVHGEVRGAVSCLFPFCSPDVSGLAKTKNCQTAALADGFFFMPNTWRRDSPWASGLPY